jgi:hypothetical protein
LTGGLAAVAAVLVTVALVMTGAGWLLAVSLQARSDIRSAVSLASPSGRLALTGLSAGAMPTQSEVVASLLPPATRRASEIAVITVLEPLGRLALVMPEPAHIRDDRSAIHTGSLGASNIALTLRDEVQPLPLPRVRPKLASLPPLQDLGIQTEEAPPARTAIYDITARTVYMPNGDRLEAHSGFGEFMDDPRHVQRKMRGATPPNTYNLRLRESLFHGVQAIRLKPVNEAEMFNRDGILAHTYMLGPSGQSNGCVSFKDYSKFLNAFLRGEVDRMIVVARLDRPPAYAARLDKPPAYAGRLDKPPAFAARTEKSQARLPAHSVAHVQATDRVEW